MGRRLVDFFLPPFAVCRLEEDEAVVVAAAADVVDVVAAADVVNVVAAADVVNVAAAADVVNVAAAADVVADDVIVADVVVGVGVVAVGVVSVVIVAVGVVATISGVDGVMEDLDACWPSNEWKDDEASGVVKITAETVADAVVAAVLVAVAAAVDATVSAAKMNKKIISLIDCLEGWATTHNPDYHWKFSIWKSQCGFHWFVLEWWNSD